MKVIRTLVYEGPPEWIHSMLTHNKSIPWQGTFTAGKGRTITSSVDDGGAKFIGITRDELLQLVLDELEDNAEAGFSEGSK